MTLEAEVVPFDGSLSRAEFDCGNEELNNWLRNTASQHEKRGISRTFIALPKKGSIVEWHAAGFKDVREDTILGFFCLSSAHVYNEPRSLGKGLPKIVPVVRMGRLAVQTQLQGMGFGGMLLMEAIAQAAQASVAVGIAGLFVDAKNEKAAAFYANYGFHACETDALKLWLPLSTIFELLSG